VRPAAVHPQGFLQGLGVEGKRLLEQGLQFGQEGAVRVETAETRTANVGTNLLNTILTEDSSRRKSGINIAEYSAFILW